MRACAQAGGRWGAAGEARSAIWVRALGSSPACGTHCHTFVVCFYHFFGGGALPALCVRTVATTFFGVYWIAGARAVHVPPPSVPAACGMVSPIVFAGYQLVCSAYVNMYCVLVRRLIAAHFDGWCGSHRPAAVRASSPYRRRLTRNRPHHTFTETEYCHFNMGEGTMQSGGLGACAV